MDLFSALFDRLCNLLFEGLGRVVLRFLSSGRYPGKSAYWDGICEIIGLIIVIAGIIANVVLVYALTN